VGPRLCLAAAWAAWTIKPTLNRNDEGPGLIPGLFCPVEQFLCCFDVGQIEMKSPAHVSAGLQSATELECRAARFKELLLIAPGLP
jgi:hypothetical protein